MLVGEGQHEAVKAVAIMRRLEEESFVGFLFEQIVRGLRLRGSPAGISPYVEMRHFAAFDLEEHLQVIFIPHSSDHEMRRILTVLPLREANFDLLSVPRELTEAGEDLLVAQRPSGTGLNTRMICADNRPMTVIEIVPDQSNSCVFSESVENLDAESTAIDFADASGKELVRCGRICPVRQWHGAIIGRPPEPALVLHVPEDSETRAGEGFVRAGDHALDHGRRHADGSIGVERKIDDVTLL